MTKTTRLHKQRTTHQNYRLWSWIIQWLQVINLPAQVSRLKFLQMVISRFLGKHSLMLMSWSCCLVGLEADFISVSCSTSTLSLTNVKVILIHSGLRLVLYSSSVVWDFIFTVWHETNQVKVVIHQVTQLDCCISSSHLHLGQKVSLGSNCVYRQVTAVCICHSKSESRRRSRSAHVQTVCCGANKPAGSQAAQSQPGKHFSL